MGVSARSRIVSIFERVTPVIGDPVKWIAGTRIFLQIPTFNQFFTGLTSVIRGVSGIFCYVTGRKPHATLGKNIQYCKFNISHNVIHRVTGNPCRRLKTYTISGEKLLNNVIPASHNPGTMITGFPVISSALPINGVGNDCHTRNKLRLQGPEPRISGLRAVVASMMHPNDRARKYDAGPQRTAGISEEQLPDEGAHKTQLQGIAGWHPIYPTVRRENDAKE